MKIRLFILAMLSALLLTATAFSVSEKQLPQPSSGLSTILPRYSADEIVSIRIYSAVKIQSLLFAPTSGSYQVVADGKTVYQLDNKNVLKISLISEDSIEVKTVESLLGKFKQLKIQSDNLDNGFKLRLMNPDKKPRFYDGNLTISPGEKRLALINQTRLDHYIAGVTEAESGRRSSLEFYKVQAILARTYALGHLHKHAAEGYNLCDQVHCQVFYGKTGEGNILEAVKLTRGQVVVDQDLQLITAAFHSNSGGQTVNSEDVWGTNTSYLRSVRDSFSTKMPNARWERKLATDDWLSYLKIRYNYPVEDSAAKDFALHFSQENRKVNLEYGGIKVPLKNIRSDFQLKSTFFSIDPHGDTLILRGRGFGHGIGMCQEGAMCMTKCGYSYKDVLSFYYQKVHLVDIQEMNFFREE